MSHSVPKAGEKPGNKARQCSMDEKLYLSLTVGIMARFSLVYHNLSPRLEKSNWPKKIVRHFTSLHIFSLLHSNLSQRNLELDMLGHANTTKRTATRGSLSKLYVDTKPGLHYRLPHNVMDIISASPRLPCQPNRIALPTRLTGLWEPLTICMATCCKTW